MIVLFNQGDATTERSQFARRGEPGEAAADDQDFGGSWGHGEERIVTGPGGGFVSGPILPPRPATILVPVRTTCIRCGYDLAGLTAESMCPECGCEVRRSLESRQWLRAADPVWLRGVCRGLTVMHVCLRVLVWALFAMGTSFVLFGVLYAAGVAAANGFWSALGKILTGTVVYVILPAWGLAFSVGMWWTSEAAQPPYGPTRAWRTVARVSCLAMSEVLALASYRAAMSFPITRLAGGVLIALTQAAILGLFFSYVEILGAHAARTLAMNSTLERTISKARQNLLGVCILMVMSWMWLFKSFPTAAAAEILWLILAGVFLFPMLFLYPMARDVRAAVEDELKAQRVAFGPGGESISP